LFTFVDVHCCAVVSSIRPPAVWKGAIIKIHSLLLSFRPSICPSVAYTANNSTTQRPSVHKFGRKVPHLWCDSHTSFKVKKSGSPGPLTLTYIVCRIFRIGLRTSNLVYRWRTTTRISHRRCDLLGQRSRSQGHVDQSEPSWPNAVPVSLEAGGGILCRPNSGPHLLLNLALFRSNCFQLHLFFTALQMCVLLTVLLIDVLVNFGSKFTTFLCI